MPDPKCREALIEMEASMQTGGLMVLNEKEKRLNSRLLQMKKDEVMRADFPPAMHFFKAKELIRKSPIFSLLQKMPKGMSLCVVFTKNFYQELKQGHSTYHLPSLDL